MIVNIGKEEIAVSYIAVNYRKIKVGNGGDDTAASQTKLDSIITIIANDNTDGNELVKTVIPSVIGSELVWTVSFTGTELGTQGVAELGIFHSTSDKLLSRVTFANTGIVPSTDTVTFTVRLEVN